MRSLIEFCHRRPTWVPRAAQYWSVLYGALALHWLLGGRASFPFANVKGDPPGGTVTAVVVSLVVLIGAVAGVLSARPPSARATSRPTARASSAGLVVATTTAAVGTFGLALSGVGIIASGTIERPLALAAQLFASVGALLLFGTTQVHARQQRGRCPRCGADHPPTPDAHLVRLSSNRAPTRTRRTAYLILLGLLPWAITKVIWSFGGTALGVTADEWRTSMDNSEVSALSRLLDRFGIDITVLASLVGVLLVLALLHRWGLHIPRWLLLLPAWIGGISLTLYGVPLTAWGLLTLTGATPTATDPGPFTPTGLAWMILFGGTAFATLGTALALAARSYHHRTQPTCAPAP